MRGVGYFFVHRRLWFSDSASLRDRGEPEARRREAWIWLLAQANWDDADGLRPGQLRTSRGQISAYTGWPDGKVRAWLKCLLKEGAISLERQGNHSIITVENWSNYQQSARLDLGPTQYQASTNPVPTQVQPSVSVDRQSLAIRSDLGPTWDQARSDLGPATLKEERTKNEEQNTPAADGNELPGVGGDGETKDEKPKKPPIAAWNEWPAVKANQKWAKFPYPDAFIAIWDIWRQTAKRNPNVKAVGKADSYRLCLRWLHEGFGPDQLLEATKDYLRPFYAKPDKTHCQHPTTVYSHAHPTLPDRLDSSPISPPSMTQPMRKRWSAPYTAWSSCVSVCDAFDLPIPEKDGPAKWEDVEKFHPLIIANASDDHQLRRPPEDLRQQVMQ